MRRRSDLPRGRVPLVYPMRQRHVREHRHRPEQLRRVRQCLFWRHELHQRRMRRWLPFWSDELRRRLRHHFERRRELRRVRQRLSDGNRVCQRDVCLPGGSDGVQRPLRFNRK